ncbi:cell wall metabolism sensor histidine kinase WalK [Paenibacillus sp. NAIST15-1]|uniref:sensor histidine kinase n=1 Tax=Paenibacillus sp. NAIST15-1 TaxID=1605994 RepID=UPI0009350CC6|nr:ATP-binding protein [Paenibacillus sp. NAIST15-1]
MTMFKSLIQQLKHSANTLMFRFTIWYVLSLLAVILLIGICIMGAVTHLLLQDSKQELFAVERKLRESIQDGFLEWQSLLDELLYPDHANYDVQIVSSDGRKLAQTRNWDEAFLAEQKNRFRWFDTVQWNTDYGLFIRDEVIWNQTNGQVGRIYIHVQLHSIERILLIMTKVLVITALASSTAGSLLIYQITRRNLSPLFSIMNSIVQMKNSPNLRQRVHVPKTPVELTKLAERFNQLLDEHEELIEREMNFITNASHELRTPLTAFRGHVKLLKRWGNQNAEVLQKSLDSLDLESQRMQRLIVQLLTLARSGKSPSPKEQVNLTDIVREAIKQLWKSDSKISLRLHLNKAAYVHGDKEQLRQVAIILIENAIRYTNDLGWIEVAVYQEKENACLRVSDSGIGIPEEELDKIFDRFYRVDKARSRVTGGTGLGLPIAKELVEQHHGTIRVESTIGQGSTFIVCIPYSHNA